MCCLVIWSKIAVLAAAGVTQLTSTPVCASSFPSDLVSAITPALEALYATALGLPSLPAIEAMLTMRPYLRLTMWGTTARQHRNWLVRFTRSTRSHSSTGYSTVGEFRPAMPALFTSMSIPPTSATAFAVAFSTCAGSDTSTGSFVAAKKDPVDVSDPAQVEKATAKAVAEVGGIDILVNNAGIAGLNSPTVEYPVDEWERVLRVNLTSQFLCCRAVVPHMVKRKYGRIVNIASIAGKEGNPNAVAYSASKAGVIALTKSLGKELARTGVLVNCVTPAAAKTAIFDQMTREHISYMLSKIPMNRFVTVEEIAALVCWLASEDCSFSTGAVFDISGGRATY